MFTLAPAGAGKSVYKLNIDLLSKTHLQVQNLGQLFDTFQEITINPINQILFNYQFSVFVWLVCLVLILFQETNLKKLHYDLWPPIRTFDPILSDPFFFTPLPEGLLVLLFARDKSDLISECREVR